jgi:hypothetical protein
MPPLWISINEAAGRPAGLHHYTMTADEVFHRCGTCDACFPQTDEGWAALRDHEFDLHERPIHYDWRELDGLQVRLQVVRRQEQPRHFSPPEGHVRVEVAAVAADGTMYFFPFDGHEERDDYHGDGKLGYFKVKPRANVGRLLGAGTP